MPKYRKKSIVIEAIQYSGENDIEISDFINKIDGVSFVYDYAIIKTLEGRIRASRGDYIIKKVNGEFYPCEPDIFEATYELVE